MEEWLFSLGDFSWDEESDRKKRATNKMVLGNGKLL